MAAKRDVSPAEFLSMIALTSLLLLAFSVSLLGEHGSAQANEILQKSSDLLRRAPH